MGQLPAFRVSASRQPQKCLACVKCIINSLALNCCTQRLKAATANAAQLACVYFSLPATVRKARPGSSPPTLHPSNPSPAHGLAEPLPIIKRLCYRILCFMQLGFEGTSLQAKCLSPRMDVSCVIRVRARDWNDFVSRLPSTLNHADCCLLCLWSGSGIITIQ